MKRKVLSYWEVILRDEAAKLTSLRFFRPEFMSISKPHPLWTTAGPNFSKVTMATIQATMLSGRYRTQSLLRHWGKSDGYCSLSQQCCSTLEDLQHILQYCPALTDSRNNLMDFTRKYCSNLPPDISKTILSYCDISNPLFMAIPPWLFIFAWCNIAYAIYSSLIIWHFLQCHKTLDLHSPPWQVKASWQMESVIATEKLLMEDDCRVM